MKGAARLRGRTWVALAAMLLAAPVLQTFATNSDRLPPRVMLRPLGFLLLGVALLAGLARWLLVGPERGGPLGVAAALTLFLPSHALVLASVLSGSGLPAAAAGPLGLALAGSLALTLVALAMVPDSPWLRGARTAAAGLALWVFGVAVLEASWSLATVVTAPFPARLLPAATRRPVSPPDLFHVVLDGMPAPMLERDLLGQDPAPFVAALEARGFRVAPRTRSPYAFTLASMAAILGADLLPPDAASRAGATRNRRPLRSMVEQAPVFEPFRQQGYRVVVITSGAPGFEFMRADRVIGSWPTDFENRLITSSLVGVLAPSWQYGRRRALLERAFRRLEQAAREPGPLLVFCHVLAPHAPAVLDAEGRSLEVPALYRLGPLRELGLKACRRRLAGQVRWVQRRLLEAVDAIQARPGRRAAFLVHGDHGPGEFYAGDDPELRCRAVFETLHAEILPDVPAGNAAPDRGLVNAYLPVLEAWFGVSLEARSRRSSFSTWDDPYRLRDCPEAPASSVLP